uniref:DNA repair protein UVH3 n=1 Tax=Rhizophora mucronata TaxID=61149 RepID=A0A2P2KUJ2_RHIMU
MGVQGLWDLLAPVGRRVSVETLSGKKLAIDASIWMVQFMKAMRDEKGEMVRNGHLLGFFRRICKLLYLRTKPVFVFDGGTPALKRRTVIARRRQRENAQAKIRKTAEKLLLNHLKAMRLKELANDLDEQRKKQGSDAKGTKVLARETDVQGSNLEKDNIVSESFDRENFDEMLAASIAAEEEQCLNSNASRSAAATAVGGPIEEEDDDEEMILPEMDGDVDPSILAALPPSMQLNLLMRDKLMTDSTKNTQDLKKVIGNENEKRKLNAKGKEILTDQTDTEEDDKIEDSYNQEKLDKMLAASIMADEDGSLTTKASASAATFPFGEEDADEYEEIVLPAMHSRVDPAVLAALPPSMQLDLLVQVIIHV